MFQPLIELMNNKLGVSEFNIKVSGSPELMTLVITPSLSAPPADRNRAGYKESQQVYRALLTTPLVVRAPLADVDTRLAELVESYVRDLGQVMGDKNVSSMLAMAAEAAVTAVENTGKRSQSTATRSLSDEVQEESESGGNYDADVLASLGL
jgi:hypothetical protein